MSSGRAEHAAGNFLPSQARDGRLRRQEASPGHWKSSGRPASSVTAGARGAPRGAAGAAPGAAGWPPPPREPLPRGNRERRECRGPRRGGRRPGPTPARPGPAPGPLKLLGRRRSPPGLTAGPQRAAKWGARGKGRARAGTPRNGLCGRGAGGQGGLPSPGKGGDTGGGTHLAATPRRPGPSAPAPPPLPEAARAPRLGTHRVRGCPSSSIMVGATERSRGKGEGRAGEGRGRGGRGGGLRAPAGDRGGGTRPCSRSLSDRKSVV